MTRKRILPSRAARLLAAFGALVISTSTLAGQPLFVGQAKPTADGARTTQRLAAKADTAGLRVVKASPAVVAAGTREIEVELGGRRVNLVHEGTQSARDGSLVWTGHVRETAPARSMTAREVRHDANNSAILVRRGQGITGNIRVDGQLFRIRPIAGGQHAVIEVDETRMPADHPVQFDRIPQVRMAADKALRTRASGTVGALAIDPGPTATIRVMVVATNDSIAAYGGDMQALVQLAVAETNQGYVNSNIGISMELANYSTTSYATAGMSTDLTRFRGIGDGFLDTIHATRDSSAADVAVLVSNDGSACGLASSIGSNAATAFATAYWDCITGYYSFAHEVGHLQSARHDPAADGSTTPYAYGHGYRAPNNAWRTIMAYNCSGAGCPRLNYWSNPDVTYIGQAMGTTDVSHNQRVLVATKATIAAYRDNSVQTYTNATDFAIADRTTVNSPINVSGRSGNAPSNGTVTVAIVHTYIGDLKVELLAPDGTVRILHNRTGGSADNINRSYTLDLSTETLNGTWTLRVNDNAAGDIGKVDSWSIRF